MLCKSLDTPTGEETLREVFHYRLYGLVVVLQPVTRVTTDSIDFATQSSSNHPISIFASMTLYIAATNSGAKLPAFEERDIQNLMPGRMSDAHVICTKK